MHSENTLVREGLLAQREDEDNIDNDPMYVEGEEEVEEIIVKEEKEEEDKDECFSHSSKEGEEVPKTVQKKS